MIQISGGYRKPEARREAGDNFGRGRGGFGGRGRARGRGRGFRGESSGPSAGDQPR